MTLSFTRIALSGLLVALMAMVLPLAARADDGSDHTDTDTAVSAEVKTEVKVDTRAPGIRTLFERRQENKSRTNDDGAIVDDNNKPERRDVRVREDVRTGAGIDDDTKGERREIRVREDVRTDVRADVRAQAEVERERGRENAIARIKTNLVRFVHILEAGINRVETLADRIQARADKMEANGTDVTEAELFLAEARLELDLAAGDLAAIRAAAEADATVGDETTPADVFKEVRDLLKSARKHIGEAHKALKDAVQSLRKAVVEVTVDVEAESN